jgi:hypothetical protein
MILSSRISKETIATSIVVRRQAKVGASPFGWEVHVAGMAEPLHVSPKRFTSMMDAYGDGQSRLPEFVTIRSTSPEQTVNHRWLSHDLVVEAQSPTAARLETSETATDHG